MKKKSVTAIMVGFLCLSMFPVFAIPQVQAQLKFQAKYRTTVPVIDGRLTGSEWNDANSYDIPLVHITSGSTINARVYFKYGLAPPPWIKGQPIPYIMYIALRVYAPRRTFDEFTIYFDEGNDGAYGSGTRDRVLTNNQEDLKTCFYPAISGYYIEDGCRKNGAWYAYYGGTFTAKCVYVRAVPTSLNRWECEFQIPLKGRDGLDVNDVSDLVCSPSDTIGIKIQYFTQPGQNNYFYPPGPNNAIQTYTVLSFLPQISDSITVTSPNGGEVWARGSTHLITWTWTGSVGANVKIELLKGGVVKGTIPSTANDGSYSWTIGMSHLGSDYKIRITSISNPTITDSSNSDFTIDGVPVCSITVTSPNGGEVWARGTTHAITWTSTSAGANVKIELLKGGVVKGTIPSTANDGSYSWTIGMSHLGSDYKIRITSTSDPACTDSSDNNFQITT